MRRRADALFELTDAVLAAGLVPSPPHLILAPVHRRGWCSLYAALAKGRIDDGDVRELCARYPLAEGGSPVYAVDVRTNTPTISQEAFRTTCRTKGRTSENSVKAKFAEFRLAEVRILGILRSSPTRSSRKFGLELRSVVM